MYIKISLKKAYLGLQISGYMKWTTYISNV